MTKLYELSRGSRFRFADPMPVPVDAHLLGNGVLTLKNIDGAYSYCTDDAGNVYHPAAWSKVVLVEGDN